MKYVNVRTGAVIETACMIKGDCWKLVEKQPEKTSTEIKDKTKKQTSARTRKKGGE